MIRQLEVNRILDRLPIMISGIIHNNYMFTGEVCPKLNNYVNLS